MCRIPLLRQQHQSLTPLTQTSFVAPLYSHYKANTRRCQVNFEKIKRKNPYYPQLDKFIK